MADAALLDHLAATDTVAIVTTRPDGSERATPIWIVVVDGAAYARSAYGARAGWYRRARSGRPVAFTLTDGRKAERDAASVLGDPRGAVTVADIATDAPVQSAIDAAFRAKYATSPVLSSIFAPQTVATTVRFDEA